MTTISSAGDRADEPLTLAPVSQPIVCLTNRTTVALELLARWRSPESSALIAPQSAFAAGVSPMSTSLLMLAPGAALAARSGLPVHVNVPPSLLLVPEHLCLALAVATEHNVPTHRLILELTETEPMTHKAVTTAVAAWRAAGFAFAIDDVGAGFSDIAAVDTLRPEIVKTDRSLLSAGRTAELRQVVAHAKGVGATVVVEGIANADDFAVAVASGAESGQGWHLGMAGEHSFGRY